MKKSLLCLFVLVASYSFAASVSAQINVTMPGQEVRIGKDGGVSARSGAGSVVSNRGNEASVSVGSIAEDADVEGVTVINGRVSIDGRDVPANVSRYKSPKTGKVYLIHRQSGGVSVSEAGGGK